LPTSADSVLLDASAALALVDPDHVFHGAVFAAVVNRRRGLAGHAAFETYSVLTRQPPPRRILPRTAQRIIETNFGGTHYLSSDAAAGLAAELAALDLSGGAVFDALVAAAARESGLVLLSCDRRAVQTYLPLGIRFELIT
jgi:toxin FitB